MNRRLFVQTGLASLLLPGATVAMNTAPAAIWTHIFYDPRFAGARDFATQLAGSTVPTAVGSDVTELWTRELARSALLTPLRMAGVTTESLYFCLEVLAADRASVDAEIRRIGQDLHFWTLRSEPHPRHGTTS